MAGTCKESTFFPNFAGYGPLNNLSNQIYAQVIATFVFVWSYLLGRRDHLIEASHILHGHVYDAKGNGMTSNDPRLMHSWHAVTAL